MDTKEAVELIRKNLNGAELPEELKDALRTVLPEMERLLPVIPTKGRQGTYMTYNCGFCHTGISAGSRYCYRCGHKVDLEHSDLPAIRADVVIETGTAPEEPEPEKRPKARERDIEGQQSFFDLMED